MNHSKLSQIPRERFAHLPTPLEYLPRLTAHLNGPQIFVKRDDCTGLASGGNKTRKLEFLLADAMACSADTVITTGGVQSNHARQTAAAAARCGMHCELILPRSVAWSDPAYERTGNVLYDRILGAKIHLLPTDIDRDAVMMELAESLRREGRTPYVIPTGGSNAVGALGYVDCVGELVDQAHSENLAIDALVVASGSGGTQAGLVVGRTVYAADFAIVGISDGEPRAELESTVRRVAGAVGSLLDVTPHWERVEILDQYIGPGYGLPSDAMLEAVTLVARTEGLLLDPVYTGKAMAGLIDLVRSSRFGDDQTVVFLHTGGSAALSAYPDLFTADS
ncbi:MAG: D-cysteine desulfhydrase [Gammaproteobacteria bacterium]|nr:D-cysteine desulfhydrase [Gammaproteobacteria bacterium]